MAEAAAERSKGASLARVPWSVVSTIGLAAVLVLLVATYRPSPDPATEIGSIIRCPVCQGVAITDSPSPMARDMMLVLRQALEEGASRRQAIDEVLGAYPGSLLLEPEFSAATAALWVVPLAGAGIGAGLFWTVRRSRSGSLSELERPELKERIAQIESDLADLAAQTASGEIEAEPARHLRVAYATELEEAREALRRTVTESEPAPTRSPKRVATGAVFLIGSLAVVMWVASAFLVDRPDTTAGVAGLTENPESFSNETLAAVIASNQDHPQIDGMRLALAERYFESGDYQAAFPYYLDITSSDAAQPPQVGTSLSRLGWMAYDGNGEIETALDLFEQARQITPNDPFPLYLTGIVRWCGQADNEAAAAAFTQVLDSPLDDPAIRSQIETELAAVEAGEECQP